MIDLPTITLAGTMASIGMVVGTSAFVLAWRS